MFVVGVGGGGILMVLCAFAPNEIELVCMIVVVRVRC